MRPNSLTIRASEIGTYLFCQRAWSYQRQGLQSANVREMARGNLEHERHGRGFRRVLLMRRVAWGLLLLALILLALQLIGRNLP